MYRCLLCGVENHSRRFFTLKNNNMLVKKMIPLLERASDINIAHRSDRICSQLASSCLKRLSMLNDLIQSAKTAFVSPEEAIPPMPANPVTVDSVPVHPVTARQSVLAYSVTVNPVTVNPVTVNPVTANPVD